MFSRIINTNSLFCNLPWCSAIITLCCPCVTFGQIANRIDNGRTSCETAGCIYTGIALCIAMPCIYSCTYRTKLRNHFGLFETPASDCITHLCCEYCALCQEYRELNYRGLNPSAGMYVSLTFFF
ncbi:putative PLAC8 motif-containing protein [Helianthus anomalus]